jgi:lipopolysaccharide export system protein LptA
MPSGPTAVPGAQDLMRTLGNRFVESSRISAAGVGWQAILCCTLLILAAGAGAEKADREKPVNLEADRVTIDDSKQIALFEGNVVLTQGTLQIRGDRMEVRQDKDGFKQGTTWGNLVYFRQKREGFDEYIEGWAERVEYDGRAETMQLFNRAQLKRGPDEIRGNYISYDSRTEFFEVVGGGAKGAGPDNPEGRVRAVIQPKPPEKPAVNPPVNLQPAETINKPREDARTRKK